MQFLEGGLYDCLGSDAHSSRHLAGMLEYGLREVELHAGTAKLYELLGGLPFVAGREQKPEVRDGGLILGVGR